MIELPEISDDDVSWVCELLGLPATAFSGVDGTDPRLGVLKTNTTIDVEACPGSGKTTLLVAKLAILARHWHSRERGICVLSHTNAARREIEKKLGATSEGQRLLSYPHFVGTIHGFVNEYLALPWLRSLGVTVDTIDDDICLNWRWRQLPFDTRQALAHKHKSLQTLRYHDAEFDLGVIPWGQGRQLGAQTATYSNIQNVCISSCQSGFFCHDEMFVWASDLLEKEAAAARLIRQRFPVLLIDEVQDNSELQSSLLHRTFMSGDTPVLRQRFGDQNQAIYAFQGQVGSTTDSFPSADITHAIPNSHRFGNSIAELADPLAISPYAMVGQGGTGKHGEPEQVGRHAVFLFDDDSVTHVLDAYVDYLRQVFGATELLEGDFTAVGAVHKTVDDQHIPKSVGHYWPDYDPEISGAEPKPGTMAQHVLAGHRLSQISGETNDCVEKIAQGVLRLARLMSPDRTFGHKRRIHRVVLGLLEGHPDAIDTYLSLVQAFAVAKAVPSSASWNAEHKQSFELVGQALAGVDTTNGAAETFISWDEPDGDEPISPRRANIVKDEGQEPPINVRVGSIHSVKGETHTATLVLDTYFKAHHLRQLKPWLLGTNSGGAGQNDTTLKRLKLHYVGMTRASRLLCLAMRADVFDDAEIEQLKDRGWRVAKVQPDGCEWLN